MNARALFLTVGLLAAAPAASARADSPPPGPLPFLAPPPLTSQTPEALQIRNLPSPPPSATNGAPSTNAPASDGASQAPAPDATAAPQPEPSAGANDLPLIVPRPPAFFDAAGRPDELPAHLLVVYNQNDPDSRPLAEYYAQRRGIPAERVLALNCPVNEEITRDEFEQTIREPILNDLFRHDWIARQPAPATLGDRTLTVLAATRNDIWAIVLMRGVPLKIKGSAVVEDSVQPQPLLQTDAAAVDSELAMLPVFGLPLGGFVPNPFYDAENTGQVRAGPELARKLVLVTRLDGPTAADVRRMINDCLQAEDERLAGQAVIDSRGLTDAHSGYTQADGWLRAARNLLALAGWPVLFDDHPATLPTTEPVNQVAFYLGWYTPNADGPWITPPDRFVPGAIAYHLHSYSASTVRSTTENWVGPLIAHGADATMGNVYEPYLVLTPHLDIFTKRLLDGDSLAEAAYASELGLSWMTTVVGDPLYRPFRKPLADAIAAAPPGPHRDWLRLQEISRGLDARPPATVQALQAAFPMGDAGPVLEEHLGDLVQKLRDPAAPTAAEAAYTLALGQSPEPVDHIRVGLKLARVEAEQGQIAQAQATLQQLRDQFPLDAPRFGIAPLPATPGVTPGATQAHPAARSFDGSAP